jgi:hypothetical protein
VSASLEYILPAIAQNIERERRERVKVLAEAASLAALNAATAALIA